MVPNRLEEWNIKHVEQLVERGVYEGDLFDLKEMLPHRSDETGKNRLRKTCAAFANTAGGFIVFGVSDDREKSPAERIVGIDQTVDFPAQFGNLPSGCEPAVEWQPKTPALSISGGRVVHVVQIPRSWRAPHAIADGDGWVFPKRTSKGTEPMSYSEVQSMFLGYYEKRMKLQLLRAELVSLTNLKMMMALVDEENSWAQNHLPPIELRIIENVLNDTYSITHHYPGLLTKLAELRQEARSLNSLTEILRMQIAVHPTAGQQRVKLYLSTLNRHVVNIEGRAKEAIAEVEKVIGSA